MVYLTGDCHGDFERIAEFCDEFETNLNDVMIILGDAGFNYNLDERDEDAKRWVSQLPITLFCVHGNHEERPCNIQGYETVEWRGGSVWFQPEYPNILFPEDGAVFAFGDKKGMVIGGAYSVDKYYRVANGLPWFESEQPDERVMADVEAALDRMGWEIDYLFSHTVPLEYIPQDALLPGINQSTVDNSTEQWLSQIERKLAYSAWYAGHYHITRDLDRVSILYEDYLELEE